jgi:hypothetical protein
VGGATQQRQPQQFLDRAQGRAVRERLIRSDVPGGRGDHQRRDVIVRARALIPDDDDGEPARPFGRTAIETVEGAAYRLAADGGLSGDS